MSLVAAGFDRQGILAATRVIVTSSSLNFVKLTVQTTQKIYRIIIGVAHVPWLARLMAWPTLSTYFQKPVFDEQGQPKGLSAAGMVCF